MGELLFLIGLITFVLYVGSTLPAPPEQGDDTVFHNNPPGFDDRHH